ncbi:MAG TPA: alpha/beta-hydrolase family protein [Nocardioides sp.]|uniref:alpha/beta hydrolase n=1 Tax=Nocardioides sp. TaxID=35761 RepID=UPI002D80C2D7|nr:alpha/beta-hydrolase family protein [Nocardioides sp.]HET6651244.1 alpha/beta-hydrolase family protein [Nocardioides sp.]
MAVARLRRWAAGLPQRLHYDLPGAWVALVFALLSFTPSLLPRPPEFQGLLVGINSAIGYGLGVVGAWVWRELADREVRPPRAGAWRWYAVTAAVTVSLAVVLGEVWQRELRDLVGLPGVSPLRLVVLLMIALVVFVVLVGIGRAFRRAYLALARRLRRRTSERAARALGLIALVTATALVFSGVVWDGLIRFADRTYAVADLTTPANLEPPASTLRSGGPESLVAWEDLGREGRKFTGRGPTPDEISGFTGAGALEPIRVYAGMAAAESAEERAALAVRDLVRAGGLERRNLLVVTTTGTGWVEPSSTASFEYLTGGDSAIVSMQYSHLPSWLSFLVDQDRAREAGRELFDAVYEEWLALDPGDRPRLYVFGESLGSFGGETAFSGEADMRIRLDGALFTGPPNFNPLYRGFIDDRDGGSPEVEPVYRGGRTIRFSQKPRDPVAPADREWGGSRVLYMQHASDPVTWWSPDLFLTRPDWLEEPPGRDVLPEMTWIPAVTFWQVSADLALCFSMPPGHGHTFTGEHVDGWAKVLRPAGWTPEKADQLRAIIRGED